jgi:hypothetical protein
MLALSKRDIRLALASELGEAISATSRVKTAFPSSYFDSLHHAIEEASEGELYLPDHVFFFTFWDRPSIVGELEETIAFLENTTGKTLNDKIKMLAGTHSDVISIVFELIVLHRFAKSGHFRSYEPPISNSSNSKAEALVDLAGHTVLIEVQSKMQGEIPDSLDDDAKAAEKLHGKLMTKCSAGQLANSKTPAILFQDTDFGLWDRHVDAVVEAVEKDPNCASASAIVFGETYTGNAFRVWINPNARHPLSDDAADQLARLLS